MTSRPSKDSPIIIIGAGIFGLSTSLHLAQRGYRNITVFDKQPYHETLYSYSRGCDSASSDINKIIRSAYGSQTEYQDLSTEAQSAWNAWNSEIKVAGTSSNQDGENGALPEGITPHDALFIQNGHLTCSDATTLPDFERATIENMELAGHHGTQLINNELKDIKLASQQGLKSALQPFGKPVLGVLDTTGGYVLADKACRFALHKAKRLGVHFVLGPESGLFTSFVYDSSSSSAKATTGITTADGKSHPAALTIVCCGGWTPSLLPALDSLCETTAGSVFMLHIPESSPLRKHFHYSRFPSWSFNMRHHGAEGGLYGFPVDEHGILKIGYRGTKYTNPQGQSDGQERSVPVTKWSSPSSTSTIDQVPQQAHQVVTKFLDEYLPELGNSGIRISESRLCWYTDSFDNHYVIDRVPGYEGLMCATGGSGHAFKFLPNIGNWVVDVIEGVGLDRPVIKAWRWRALQDDDEPINKLMEGSQGPRSLWNVPLVSV
ncbi:fad dependent oxidoreductase [Trichoderma arundinaceum]|uniref:Fad dependent oxidoreductase n=1 Tax=Trichoderma arundinaceum TaxID=490622 RepID=A0A395NB33_TRIAR|nr:fad dependent oxidoreductase [Trichoderma arundinaceum]